MGSVSNAADSNNGLWGRFGRDSRLLVYVLIISFTAVVMSWGGIREAENHLLKTEASVTAVHWAKFLQANLSNLDEILAAGLISGGDQRVFDFASGAGRVLRYQVLRPDGVIAHSSWSGDFRKLSAESKIIKTLRSGATLTEVITEEDAAGGTAVIGQAYVPITDGGTLKGAIKVYVDMTVRAGVLREMGTRSFAALVVLLLLLLGLCGTLVWRNILYRRRAESSLLGLSRQNELLLNSAGEGIYGLDLEGRTTFVNPAAAHVVGWEPEELIGKPQHNVLHHTKPDGSPYPREECPIYAALKDEAVHHVSDEVFWRRDGTSFPVEYISTPIREAGEVVGAVVVFSDITERKKAEDELRQSQERFKHIFNGASDAIFVVDPSHERIVDANTVAHTMLEYTREELLELSMADVHPYEMRALKKFAKEVFEHGEGRTDQLSCRSKSGEHIPVEMAATRVDMQGQACMLVVARDITERKRTEEALLAAKEQAELATRAKTEFLANMSHELRTPLNAIIGFSEIMMTGLLGPIGNPKYCEYAKDINASGGHLLQLINDILDLSKIEAGKAELHEEIVDVARIITACSVLVKDRASTARVNLEEQIAEELPPLRADERKLKQIVLNLLSNAVKFTEAGGFVTVRATLAADRRLVIEVKDTGIGIAPEDIAAAMTPFGQLDGRLSRKYEGTGLGLPLTKSLVELHGGVLEIESEVGKGTVAKVLFPAERTHDEASDIKPLSVAAGGASHWRELP